MSTFRPARVGEYIDWLRGYLTQGGIITHAYDYPFANSGMLAAQRDFTTGGEAGGDSKEILVPSGVHHRSGALGHSHVYLMDGFTCTGSGSLARTGILFVPVYDDAEFDALPGVHEARERAEAELAGFEARISAQKEERLARAHTSDLSAYRPIRPTGHTVHADETVTVNVEGDGTVVLLPRDMPTRLTPDDAETLAYRILAAAKRSPE